MSNEYPKLCLTLTGRSNHSFRAGDCCSLDRDTNKFIPAPSEHGTIGMVISCIPVIDEETGNGGYIVTAGLHLPLLIRKKIMDRIML